MEDRKVRKPIMEKRRRARINRSLQSLLDLLVASDICSPQTRVHKYDKADILEMTVTYFKRLQQDRDSSTRINSYKFGFNQCLSETVSILQSMQIRGCDADNVVAALQNKMNEYYSENCENIAHNLGNHRDPWLDNQPIWLDEQNYSNVKERQKFKQGEIVIFLTPLQKPGLDRNIQNGQNSVWRPW